VPRILLLTEHQLFGQALASLLKDSGTTDSGVTVRGFDIDPDAFVRQQAASPDAVLLHVTQPVGKSVRALQLLLKESADVPVVALVDIEDEPIADEVMIAVMQAGAAGCVHRAASGGELAQALDEAANGQIAVSVYCARRLARAFSYHGNGNNQRNGNGHNHRNGNGDGRAFPETLTTREMEVLALLARGLTNLEIARDLYVSESTVRAHLRTITQKLGAHNRVHVVARAILLGMLPPLVISGKNDHSGTKSTRPRNVAEGGL